MPRIKQLSPEESKRLNFITTKLRTLDVIRIEKEFGSVKNLAVMLDAKCKKEIANPAQYDEQIIIFLSRLELHLVKPAVTSHMFHQEILMDSDESNTQQSESLPGLFAQCQDVFFQPAPDSDVPVTEQLKDLTEQIENSLNTHDASMTEQVEGMEWEYSY